MNRVKPIVSRFWVDVLIVGAAAGLLSIASRAPDPGGAAGPAWLDILFAVAFVVPLFFRHRWPMGAPLVAIAVVFAGAFADTGFFDNAFPAYLTALGIAVWFGMRPNRPEAIAGWAALQIVSVVLTYRDPQTEQLSDYFWSLVTFTIAWIIGFALGERLRETDVTRRLAEQAELEREEQARLAVAEERARIARELHDVVGHSVSVMTVQAAAVRRLLEPDQDKEREALEVVEQTGREALAEMRRMVGVLRRPEEAPALAPQPSLEHLDRLLVQTREAGLPVELRVEGTPAPLPAGVDTTAYRIVQEALTNAVKHANADRAEVLVRYGNGTVELVVSDDGRGNGDGGG
ncbi:MAG TPA: histidine kinase, partial [Gaiellaceae bacterium]|nr:histidine kinase [Gaiellaceae bacterium]